MPRAFDITPASADVRLDASGKGEVVFTVSNKLLRAVRARAQPVPEGSTAQSWLSIVGAQEQDFSADDTKLITVRMQVPAGTTPGAYGFHLLVSTLTNPDEEYAHGPAVTADVKEQKKKAFPWWLVALVGGVLVVGIGALVLAKVLGGPELHDACEKPEDCGEKLVCSPAKECLGKGGFVGCKGPEDCITRNCENERCLFPAPGADCTGGAECPDNQRCVEVRPGTKSCLLKPEEPCTGDIQCAGAYCRRSDRKCARDDGRCTPETAEDDCRPGVFSCVGGRCGLNIGQRCADHAECGTNFCLNGQCAPCTTACGFPLRCFRNTCVRNPVLDTVIVDPVRRFDGLFIR